MIEDRHGTLTAPRRDDGTQTKRETDRLWSSIGSKHGRGRQAQASDGEVMASLLPAVIHRMSCLTLFFVGPTADGRSSELPTL